MSYLDEHRDEIFKKYSDEELEQDVYNYLDGKGRLNKVLNQFFEECMYKCSTHRGIKSPMDALQSDEDMKAIFEYINGKPSFYTGSEVGNVKSFFRNASRIANKVANFPPREATDIYFRYFPDALIDREHKLNILDTSSGFGSRMSAVLLHGHNYYGFDPNPELHDKLMECAKWYKSHGFIDNKQICRLIKSGSEVYMPKYENMFDVSFTSPPYFNLEKYADDGFASTSNYNNYDLWLEEFVKPTLENTYKYLKVGGYAMINIKNPTRNRKYKFFDDWYNIFCSIDGFKPLEVFEMSQTSVKSVGYYSTYDPSKFAQCKEPVMVFKKIK